MVKKNGPQALSILHLPDVIGGHPPALARGERALGARSQTLAIAPSPYSYAADRVLQHHAAAPWRKWAERGAVFREVRRQHDIYHFNFGTSLLQAPRAGLILPDLPYYDGRRFMTFQGDDARLTYPDILLRSMELEARLGRIPGRIRSDGSQRAYVDKLRLAKRRMVISRAAKHCDHIFALNPDLLAHLPPDKTSFLPYAVELPDLPELAPTTDDARPARRPLRLVHLSTSRVVKGTGLIEEAVARAAERCAVTLDVVVQRPRHEALQRLAAADYLIDQMVLGWFGATAVEAMFLGVPVICHLDEQALELVPEIAAQLPILKTHVTQLADRIVALAQNPERRPELVARSRAYAEAWHNPAQVARRTLAVYGS